MPLTALVIRALQPREREFTVPDGGSLFLVVTPSGGKLWRFNFRFGGKQKKLAIGGFPVVSLADARAARDAAKLLLAQGFDPAAAKQDRKRSVVSVDPPSMPTLRTMARAYVGKRQREGAVPATLDKYE